MKKIDFVFIKMNSFRSQPRLIKEYLCLKKKYQCKMLLWNLDREKETNQDAISLNLYLPFGSFWLKPAYLIWFFFCLYYLIKIKPKIIHACDLEGNLIAFAYKFFNRKTKIIYDIYDVTADKYPLAKNSKLRKFLLAWEKFFVKKANYVLMPNKTRLDQLEINPKQTDNFFYEVIYNTNQFKHQYPKRISIKNKKLKIAYIGILNRYIRGIEHLFYAAQKIPQINIIIAGFGADENYFSDFFKKNQLPNLKFLGQVNFNKAKKINQNSDIIITLLSPKFNNYQYATSTKIYDAFAVMKPVISTKGTASGKLVEKTNWGHTIEYNKFALVKILKKIINNQETFYLDPKKTNQYSWRYCAQKLLKVYQNLYQK